jgi:hypothetical protein
MKQISRDITERSVQSVGECQIVGGGQFQHLRYTLLHFMANLRSLFAFFKIN